MMRQRINRCICVWVLALFFGHTASAQQYSIGADVATVPEAGFYAIDITPALSASVQSDFRDLRIQEVGGSFFTPYIILKNHQSEYNARFTEFAITDKRQDSIYTTVDIDNPTGSGISAITLFISNTAVERYTAISGSNDRSKWYIIDDNIPFHRSYDNSSGTYVQTIHFPLSSYKYFRLRIDNAHTDPLNIMKVGLYDRKDNSSAPTYIENPAPSVTQKDSSNGVSYVRIQSNASYIVSRLKLTVSGAKYYKRDASLAICTDDSSRQFYTIRSFQLVSGTEAILDLPTVKTNTFAIEIYNGDNPPLHIGAAATYLEAQQMIVWLEAGKEYRLLMGNKAATSPDYDLAHFRDSIPSDVPVLTHGPLQRSTSEIRPQVVVTEQNKWLWPTIISAVLILGVLTWRLLADVKRGANK